MGPILRLLRRSCERIVGGGGSRAGRRSGLADLAEQEAVTEHLRCLLLPLTCLAPDIVEVILDGRQPKVLRLAELLGNGPLAWNAQRETWGFSN